MKVYHIDDITRDVRIALDQNATSYALAEIGDVDTLSYNEIIKSKICDGVKLTHLNAPVHLLDGGNNFVDDIYWKEKECGWVLLPEDFMRLVVFQMSDWERPVYSAITPETPQYALQSSRFKGLRGTAQRPVCALVSRPEGRVLEFYSCKSTDARINKAVYLPYPKIDCYGGVEICERCYNAAIYAIASLVLTTFGSQENSAVLAELSKSLLL